jgi:hypothetical protein
MLPAIFVGHGNPINAVTRNGSHGGKWESKVLCQKRSYRVGQLNQINLHGGETTTTGET